MLKYVREYRTIQSAVDYILQWLIIYYVHLLFTLNLFHVNMLSIIFVEMKIVMQIDTQSNFMFSFLAIYSSLDCSIKYICFIHLVTRLTHPPHITTITHQLLV